MRGTHGTRQVGGKKGGNIKNHKYEKRHKTDKWVDDSLKHEK